MNTIKKIKKYFFGHRKFFFELHFVSGTMRDLAPEEKSWEQDHCFRAVLGGPREKQPSRGLRN